jgi:Protein of unknown function (DUF3024)
VAAIPDLDFARISKYCDKRVPIDVRDKVRLEVGVRGTAVTIFECRPSWDRDLTEWSRNPVAQLRYDSEQRDWTLYFADRNSRWHTYDMIAPGNVDDLMKEIEDDPTCIFWG